MNNSSTLSVDDTESDDDSENGKPRGEVLRYGRRFFKNRINVIRIHLFYEMQTKLKIKHEQNTYTHFMMKVQ